MLTKSWLRKSPHPDQHLLDVSILVAKLFTNVSLLITGTVVDVLFPTVS